MVGATWSSTVMTPAAVWSAVVVKSAPVSMISTALPVLTGVTVALEPRTAGVGNEVRSEVDPARLPAGVV